MTQDYYRILGVRYDAPKEEIRQAYLQLARKYHPDVNKEREAEEFLKSINEAYNILTNDEARALYDQDLDIPPPWMRTSVRAALVLFGLGVSGALTWYGLNLQKPDVVVASSGQETTSEAAELDPVAAFNAQTQLTKGENLEPTALSSEPTVSSAPVSKESAKAPLKIAPLQKSAALTLPKGSVSSKAVAPPKAKKTVDAKSGDVDKNEKNTVSIASVKVASISKSWHRRWRPTKLAFGDSEEKSKSKKSEDRKPIFSKTAPLNTSAAVAVERASQRSVISETDQKKLMASLPGKTLSYRASPSEILSTIPIPLEDGTSVPANNLLKVDTRIWNWQSGAFRKKFSKFISALIVSRDVELASEESGLSMNDVRNFARQVGKG